MSPDQFDVREEIIGSSRCVPNVRWPTSKKTGDQQLRLVETPIALGQSSNRWVDNPLLRGDRQLMSLSIIFSIEEAMSRTTRWKTRCQRQQGRRGKSMLSHICFS